MAYKDLTKHYRYSYSGSDARPYAYFEGRGDRVVMLESAHTISWSVHEAKGQARALGHRGVKGFASGVRTIAGSIITTVIEDHPLAAMMELAEELKNDPNLHWPGWSVDRYLNGVGSGIDGTTFLRRLTPTLPPINLLVQYVAEGSTWNTVEVENGGLADMIPGAAYLLVGVEFIDEGLVTSTSDSASEMTYSFMALDCKTLSKNIFETFREGNAPNVSTLFHGINPSLAKHEQLRSYIQKERDEQRQQYFDQLNVVQ